jgi:hypothetical protein
MKTEKVQEFKASRAGKIPSYEPRDLIAAGTAALSDAKAFSLFRNPYRKGTLKQQKNSAGAAAQPSAEDTDVPNAEQTHEEHTDDASIANDDEESDLADNPVELTIDDLDDDDGDELPDLAELLAQM